MQDEASIWRQWNQGAAATFPIAIAAVPIGLVCGTLAAERGLSLAQIGLMSATVFAGASQFVALGLWTEPLPIAAIVLATLMVNLRHVMMSASIARHMDLFSPMQRYVALYGLTDEVWAFSETRVLKTPLTPAYYAGLAMPLMVVWVTSTVGGGAFGKLLGNPATLGLDFVFTAMFIGLIVGFRALPSWTLVVATSAVVAAISHQLLPSPWYIIIGGLAGVSVAAFLAPGRDAGQAKEA
jgi:4-azaleucine resistance transporter AzlC